MNTLWPIIVTGAILDKYGIDRIRARLRIILSALVCDSLKYRYEIG